MGITTTHLRDGRHSIPLRIARGHFATSNFHVNCYLDMTYTKHRLEEATEVIATFLAQELIKKGIGITNEHKTIYVVTPELDSGHQLIFRSNIAHLIRNRHVLILAATIASGAMVLDAINAVRYYGGTPERICAVFSVGKKCGGIPITSIFNADFLPDYMCAPPADCPLCREGVKLDALVNAYGISSF